MLVHKEYRYEIKVQFEHKDGLYEVLPFNIKSLHVRYNYEKYNMPILIIRLHLDTKLKNSIINNFKDNNKDFVNLFIYKYIYNSKEEDLNNNVIKNKLPVLIKRFNYVIEGKYNQYNKDNESPESQDSEDVDDITIGLIDLETFNKNKVKINSVIRNSTLKSLLCFYLSRYNILIEPFVDKKFDQFIISPLESITELLEYIFNYHCFYKTGYILFHDFDKSYLISKSGNLIKEKGKKHNIINIEINNYKNRVNEVNNGAYYKDDKSIMISVSNNDDITIYNHSKDKSLRNIGLIASDGQYKEVEIYKNAKTKNTQIFKINTPNIDMIDVYKYEFILGSKIIQVSKSGIDSSEFTINKEYNIINNETNEIIRCLLVEKLDIYLRVKEEFILNTTFKFKVIPE